MYANRSYPQAKALSRSFVAALPERGARAKNADHYEAAAIVFGGDQRVTRPLREFDRAALDSNVQSTSVLGRVDGRGGSTPLHDVLSEIGSQLEGTRGRTAVVLFTDGRPDDEELALEAARDLIASRSEPICLHGVQVGDSPEGERFLRTLAEVSSPCGSFRRADDVRTSAQVASFTRGVMLGSAPTPRRPPAVAAADPCAQKVVLHDVEFDFDAASIRSGETKVLRKAADRLLECPEVRLEIAGHTDSRGSAAYNEGLSERRAESVRRYLVERGVSASQLSARGLGESSPIDTNDTPDGRQRNRRVELIPER